MLPVIAIIGQPNVGKSTLFNRLTKTQQALVVDMPGVTRDRSYGEGQVGSKPYIVIDTGGITGQEEGIDAMMAGQSWQAIVEADVVLFLVDGRAGVTPNDITIAKRLRGQSKPVVLVVNKMDGLDEALALSEFYELGLGEPVPIAASHGRGVKALADSVLQDFEAEEKPEVTDGINIAIVGRPNVGKSTLVNRMLGEERVVVFDQPGTTRDSIHIPLEREGRHYTIIDTAGVRRRRSRNELVEKFSVVKTLKAIESAHVVIFLLDGTEDVTDQDMSLLGFVLESGRSLVLAINKWDGLDDYQRKTIKTSLDRKLQFVDFAETFFISALHGTNVGHLFEAVHKAYDSASQDLSTNRLTNLLEKAIAEHQPPLVRGRRIKLRYAHAGGKLPPKIVIHGNQTESLPVSYQRYLSNFYRQALKLVGTPVQFVFKTGDNPFKGRRNTLTPRQKRKRERIMKQYKKKK